MRIDLIYRKVCDTCEGNYVGEKITSPPYKIPTCKHCISGYTEETMEFEWINVLEHYGSDIHYLNNDQDRITLNIDKRGRYIFTSDANKKDITESLNPQSLHIIEERDGVEKVIGKYEWIK